MSGLIRPVGPEGAQTYWARRGLVLGATVVLASAVLLIISGASIGSAVHANPSPSIAFELGISSGKERIWSTADCRSIIKPISSKLRG